MKKIFTFLICCVLVFASVIPAFARYNGKHFGDALDVVSAEKCEQFESKLTELSEKTGVALSVALSKNSEATIENAKKFTENLYSENENTVMLLMNEDVAYALYDKSDVLSKDEKEAVKSQIENDINKNNFELLVEDYITLIEDSITLTETILNQDSEEAKVMHGDYVIDNADILSDEEEGELSKILDEITYRTECAIVVLTEPKIDNIESYDEQFYEEGGYGFGDNYDGILLCVDMSERYLDVFGAAGRGEAAASGNENAILSEFGYGLNGNDDFLNGFIQAARYCESLLLSSDYDPNEYVYTDENGVSYSNSTEYNLYHNNSSEGLTPKIIIICVAIGFILALIVTTAIKGKNKSVRFSAGATNYQKDGSFVLRNSRDTFLYHTVSRTPKPKDTDNHSSSGGGGGHVGGGSHGGGHF